MVFRRGRGHIIISRKPDMPQRAGSAAQDAQRARFAAATAYARGVLADPWQRRLYERLAAAQNRRVDKLVMSDFLTAPTIEEIDVSDYRRQPGGRVRVIATDDIEVVGVEIAIRTAAGVLLEAGPAARMHGGWCYLATAPTAEPVVITAVARDRPGNQAERTAAVVGT